MGNTNILDLNNRISGLKRAIAENAEDTHDIETNIYGVMGQMGAKNLVPYPAIETTKTSHGVTFTDNGDGTVTVETAESGATADASYFFCKRSNGDVLIPPGRYTLTGTPNGGDVSTYSIQIGSYIHGTTTNGQWWADAGKGITKETNVWLDISVYIQIKEGTVITTPITFKPMLRLAEDTDDTYQPYAKTNRELTTELNAVKAQIPVAPSADGTYNLSVTVADGTPVYSWVSTS